MVKVSVITVNYREAARTLVALNSLLQSRDISLEVLLIDNSEDPNESQRLATVTDPRVQLFIMEKNVGVTGAYNFGLERARGQYIFIINNDAEIGDETGLASMASYLDENPAVAAIQPKILSIKDRVTFDHSGACGGFLDAYGYPFCRGRIVQTIEEDRNQYDKVIDITWASTCCFFARREVVIEAGGFEPVYFAYAEEIDLSLAICRLGYRIQSFPRVNVYHFGGWSWDKKKPFKTFLLHRNFLILFLKCLPTGSLLRHLPGRILLELISIFFYVIKGEPRLVWSVWRSHLAVIRLLPYILRQRRNFFAKPSRGTALIYNKSIIISHYIWKKRSFNQLDTSNFSGVKDPLRIDGNPSRN